MAISHIIIDEQTQEGVWYGQDAAILKTGGYWQALEATITTNDDKKHGVSGRLIGFPCRTIRECQEVVNRYKAARIEYGV